MKNRKEIQDELGELSPFLAELKQEEIGMSVPKHYFDYLTESVMEQVTLIPKVSPSASPTSQPPWYAYLLNKRILGGLATALILLTTVLFFRNQPVSQATIAITEISSEEAAIYIAAHLEDFETTLFIESDLIEEINEIVDLEENEIDLYLDGIIEELDVETLEQLL